MDLQKNNGFVNRFDANDVAQNKVMGILAYIGILFLVPIFAAKNSPYSRFHANQGLVLFIVEAAYGIVYAILAFILAFIPIIGWITILLLGLVNIVFFVFMILGIINACSGEVKPLPIIGAITIIK